MAIAFSVAFYVWGFLGLVTTAMNFMALEGKIDVGTLTHVTASNFLWIGGMVLFGMGALINANRTQKQIKQRKSTTG